MVFGTFDLLHLGHLDFLRQAKFLGGELYIIVARDKNVAYLKKSHADWSEHQRMQKLKDLNWTNTYVYLGHENDFLIPIKKYQPDIIALGYDQVQDVLSLKNKLMHNYQLSPQIIRLKSYLPHKYKSSLIKESRN